MAHLTCVKHDRRVIVSPIHTLHRSDGTICSSKLLSIGIETKTPQAVRDFDKRK